MSNEKSVVTPIKKNQSAEKTYAFTFEVKLVVQILGKNPEEARAQLDAQGGFSSRRDVTLVQATELFSGDEVSA